MSNLRIYCRFCAEEKHHGDLASHEDQCLLIERLPHIGIVFVDFSNKMLPQTVCVTCNELIKDYYEFFLKVKKSQVVLSEILGAEVEIESGYSFSNCDVVKDENDDIEDLQDAQFLSFEDACVKIEIVHNTDGQDIRKDSEISDVLVESKSESKPRRARKKQTWTDYPWQCTLCSRHMESVAALREHCRSEHFVCFAFKCADCDEELKSFVDFVAHVRRHRKVLRNYCEYCNIKMEDLSHPHTHMTCDNCGDIFNDQLSLNSHYKLFINKLDIKTWLEYPAVCQYCGLKLVDGGVLTEHCMEVHKRCFGSRCVDCDDIILSFEEFVEHVRVHRPYLKNICPHCNIQIGDEVSHHSSQHASLHPCSICGQLFQSKKQLRAHQLILPPPNIPPKKRRKPPITKNSTCHVCGMVMKTSASLKAHLRTHTERKRNYTCDRCGKAYYTKGSLDVHHKIHENNLKEICKICQKTFLTVPRLKKHVKTHNLEMPYQCDHCKRYFNSKDRLREHVKVHMDIMPFNCQYCSKRFRHKSIMKTHENQHTGARPYSCNTCCMQFANWSNCNKHMKRKHGTTLARHVMTPHGKLALNPKTGRPAQLRVDSVLREWSERMLMTRHRAAAKTSALNQTD